MADRIEQLRTKRLYMFVRTHLQRTQNDGRGRVWNETKIRFTVVFRASQ